MKGVVYFLADPNEPTVPRYVGKTWGRLEERLGEHLRAARRGSSTYSARWIRAVLARGCVPALSVLSFAVSENALNFQERAWIDGYRAAGARLCNLTAGGEGNLDWNPTQETRARIGAASRGRTHAVSVEARERIAAWHRGRRVSEATRAKLRAAAQGRRNSAVSEANRRRTGVWKWSPERRARYEAKQGTTK